MRIDTATSEDLQPATACMVAAFSNDPHMGFFFDDSPLGRDRATEQFFAVLLDVRLALNMPVLVARTGADPVGVAMGYDTTRPEWPSAFQQRWKGMEADHPDIAARFAVCDRIIEAAQLEMPHYYLGVLAVSPVFQGLGYGKALIKAFLDLSEGDSRSMGTSIETASPSNVGLYRQLGFQTRASGSLGPATLWCMFRPDPALPVR